MNVSIERMIKVSESRRLRKVKKRREKMRREEKRIE